MPTFTTDLCLWSVPLFSVVCSVSWILKPWHISAYSKVTKGQFTYLCFMKNASPGWMGRSEGKNFKGARKGQRVETNSKTEVNYFFSIIDSLDEGEKCRTFFKYSWFDLIFSIDCINSWEEKVCIHI